VKTKKKRRVFDVKWWKPGPFWVLTERGTNIHDGFENKLEATTHGRVTCRSIGSLGGRAQLVIRGKNGRIQTEHTYPRSSDPRRSKG
jgi:hypothetical protein